MSIKVSLREGKKAVVRFNHPAEESYFIDIMRLHRDSTMPHPKIILKDASGNNILPKGKE